MENSSYKKTITLTVTEKCDLACVYCYEHKKSANNMALNTAKDIIDRELINDKSQSYMIEFFGGEPFLNFELIKKVVDYINNNYPQAYIHFFVSSNGTQVHDDIQRWLMQHKNHITVGLSFDGIKEVQNINRSDSFDKIDLAFFQRTYPAQPIKMTVSEQSLPYLSRSVIFLHEQGFRVSCNLAYMVDWSATENLSALCEQLEKLINYYVAHPDIERCSMLNLDISILSHPKVNSEYVKKFCGCGTDMRVYGVDGACYPCQLFSPIAAEDKAIKSSEFRIERDIPKELYPKMCNNCYFERICAFCLGSNYLSTGNMFLPDQKRCELNKIIFKANAKLRAIEWEHGIGKCVDEQGLLRSIIEIMEM